MAMIEKSASLRVRTIRPTRCNPILTVTTIREIAEHNGAEMTEAITDARGDGFRLHYRQNCKPIVAGGRIVGYIPGHPGLRARGYVLPGPDLLKKMNIDPL